MSFCNLNYLLLRIRYLFIYLLPFTFSLLPLKRRLVTHLYIMAHFFSSIYLFNFLFVIFSLQLFIRFLFYYFIYNTQCLFRFTFEIILNISKTYICSLNIYYLIFLFHFHSIFSIRVPFTRILYNIFYEYLF
jgi:hypothetical protein